MWELHTQERVRDLTYMTERESEVYVTFWGMDEVEYLGASEGRKVIAGW